MGGIVSGITKTLFGGSDQESKQEQSNSSTAAPSFAVRRTPFSTFDGDTLTFDPTIRNLQLSTLAGYENLIPVLNSSTNTFKTNLENTRSSLVGNSGAFRQARLNPLQEAVARRRGELTQSLGQRGLTGSSFGQQSLDNFEFDAARQIGEASALADADTLVAVTGIDKDILNAMIGKVQIEADLFQLPIQIAQQRLEQEINAFNFGKGTTSTSYGSGFAASKGDSRRGATQGFNDVFGGL